jgi:hypothetical protein
MDDPIETRDIKVPTVGGIIFMPDRTHTGRGGSIASDRMYAVPGGRFVPLSWIERFAQRRRLPVVWQTEREWRE